MINTLFSGNEIPKEGKHYIYHIEYITMKILYNENIDSVNSIYLIFNNVDGYIECKSTKESNEDKYLILASTDKNKEALGKYKKRWDKIKNQIETIIVVANQLNMGEIHEN